MKKSQFTEIKLAELKNNVIALVNKSNFDEVKKILKNKQIIKTPVGDYLFWIEINKEGSKYKIQPYLLNKDETTPLLEHIEESGKVCWRRGSRYEVSKVNVLKSIAKIMEILESITSSINYDNIISEFNLYIKYDENKLEEIQKHKLIWIINPKYKEENVIEIDKNIVFLNFNKENNFNNSYSNLFKTDLSSIRKKKIKNIIIPIHEFSNTRRIVDVLDKYKNKFKENEIYVVWITSQTKKSRFPIVVKKDKFFLFFDQKIVNRELNMKKIKCDFINKFNFIIIGLGAIGSYLTELISSLNPESILAIDGDQFLFENLSRHLLDRVFINEDASFSNKTQLIKDRIKQKFNYDINIFNGMIDHKNFLDIIKNIKENTIIINCTGELYISSLVYNEIKFITDNNIYISSLFIDEEFDWDQNEHLFFIKNDDNNKMKELVDKWGKSKSTTSKYLCTDFNKFSLYEIFRLISCYIKYFLEKIC